MAAFSVQAQSPITLTNSGYATTGADTLNVVSNLASFSNLGTPATNASWDLSTATAAANLYISKVAPPTTGNPFPAASYYEPSHYTFAGGAITYNIDLYFQLTGSGILQLGENAPTNTPIFIGVVTGGSNDSLVFNAQTVNYTPAYEYLHFPATMGTSWSEPASKATTQFSLTVAALSMNHVPGERRTSVAVSDSVIGWGKMRVALSGTSSSDWIPVLQVRHMISNTDSFYIGGTPAPASLLSNFGLSQGQVTSTYVTRFFRAGSITPLVEVEHVDNSYSGTPISVHMLKTAVDPASVKTVGNISGVQVFPNPAHDAVNVNVAGNKATGWHYALLNMMGQQISAGALPLNAAAQQARIALPTDLAKGMYVLRLSCNEGTLTTTLQIQ